MIGLLAEFFFGNGVEASALRVFDIVIFSLLGIGVLFLLVAPWMKRGKRGFPGLAVLICVGFAAVLLYQAGWQTGRFGGERFFSFMRQYNARETQGSWRMQRGKILDCNGEVLAEKSVASTARHYPLGGAAVHLVGYYDRRFGMSGVERMMNGVLRGDAALRAATDVRRGDQLRGEDVRLTLDSRLQQFAYEQMADKKGAVVVLRPRDGAILAMVTAPSYDPEFVRQAMRAEQDEAPLLNRATEGRYPPGSTFKIVMALTAAASGMSPVFDCPGEGFAAAPGASPIRDSEYYSAARNGRVWKGWGRIGLKDGFVHSSNVYFSQLGVALGAARLETVGGALELDARWIYAEADGRDMASAPGNFPEPKTRREQAQFGIGQGKILVTPLHVAVWTSVVAGGGELWQPRLLATTPPVMLRRVVDAASARNIAGYMRAAVEKGTGRRADAEGLRVCGKTGTAQAPGGDDHAWFTCFAPQENPQLVVTVLVERGGFGGVAAAPVARAVLEEAARLGVLQP